MKDRQWKVNTNKQEGRSERGIVNPRSVQNRTETTEQRNGIRSLHQVDRVK